MNLPKLIIVEDQFPRIQNWLDGLVKWLGSDAGTDAENLRVSIAAVKKTIKSKKSSVTTEGPISCCWINSEASFIQTLDLLRSTTDCLCFIDLDYSTGWKDVNKHSSRIDYAQYRNLAGGISLIHGFVPSKDKVMLITTSHGKDNDLSSLIKLYSGYICDSTKTCCSVDLAEEIVIPEGIKLWKNTRLYPEDEGISSVLWLLKSCWDNDWDSHLSRTVTNKMALGHDLFNDSATDHSRNVMDWLFPGKSTRPGFDGNSLKGLFMINRNTKVPVRSLGRSDRRDIQQSYFVAALKRLGIECELQEGIESWNLPILPGIAFLVSLKQFLNALTEDNTKSKPRQRPKSVKLFQLRGSGEFDEWGEAVIHCLKLELNSTEKGPFEMMSRYEKKGDGTAGACFALRNLLKAKTDGIRDKGEWGHLFDTGDSEEGQYAGLQFIKNGLYVTWFA